MIKLKNPPDILLVAMPFTLIRWPSLSLGLLKSILVQQGTHCQVIYANLLFADRLGLDAFLFAENGWARTFLCDWLFQRSLFPQAPFSVEAFINHHLNGKDLAAPKRERAAAITSELRRRAETFLDDLVEDIVARGPAIVGCSLTVVQLFSSLALFRKLKERNPRIITLAGGPACEGGPGLALHRHFPQMDFLFSGDADRSIHPVVTALLKHHTDLDPEAAPFGLITPAHRNTPYPTPPPRAQFDDLNQNPAPDFDDFFHTLAQTRTVKHRLTPAVPFESSRGCWWGEQSLCNFCGDCGVYPKYRARPGARVLEELNRHHGQYGITRFVATDNVLSPVLFKTFFPELVDSRRNWSLFFEIRTSLKKTEAKTLRKAGVTYVQAGIESLHTESLRAMNKGVKSWRNIQCLKWCRQYGISVIWFIMTHLPSEDDAWNGEQADLIAFLSHLQPPRGVGIVRPDRHSPYFAHAGTLDLDIQPKPAYLGFFGEKQKAAREFVFHLRDRKITERLSDPLESLVHPGRKAIQRAVSRWWKAFVSDAPPILEMKPTPSGAMVHDTRPVTETTHHRLNKIPGQVLTLADSAPKTSELYTQGVRQGIGTDRVERAVRELMERKLLVARDGRLISLVLEDPCQSLPAEKDLPVGWIEGDDRILAANPLACDAFWEL